MVWVELAAELGWGRRLPAFFVSLEAPEFQKLGGGRRPFLPRDIESSNILFQFALECVNWVKIPDEINRDSAFDELGIGITELLPKGPKGLNGRQATLAGD
jgi:hypothetical protein